jgi:hypothetical protein
MAEQPSRENDYKADKSPPVEKNRADKSPPRANTYTCMYVEYFGFSLQCTKHNKKLKL